MSYVEKVLKNLKKQNPNEPEFHQAATEILTTLAPVVEKHPEYEKAGLLERFVEPERVISRFLGGRQGQSAGKQGLPRAVQQRDWTV